MSFSGKTPGSGAGSMSGSGSDPERRRSGPSIPPPPLGRSMVGRYEVIYPLAVGGMASVHVGRLSGMAGFEKLVAIKTIHPHLAVQSEFIRMFLDEARLAARIHHPNVGEILEIGEDDGLLFMVGELIRGQDVRAIFRRAAHSGTAISHAASAYICSQVCLALHAAHSLTDPDVGSLHLVHRDISPRNVLVTYDGFVKLIDFGVASARGKLSQTDADGLKGKIGYMSPEQLRGHGIDRRSDIFSLGVMLYQMTTGAHPFPGDSDGARIERVLSGPIVPPRQINPGTRPEMEAIILKAMARDRVERYRDAQVMGRDLEEYVRRTGERVGAGALAELMTGLFADKISSHEVRLRNYRKAAAEATGIQPGDRHATGELPAILRRDAEGDTGPGTPSAMRRRGEVSRAPAANRPGRDRRMMLAGGGAVALLAGAIVLVVALVSGGDKVDADPAGGPVPVAAPAPAPPPEAPAPPVGKAPAPAVAPASTEVTVTLRLEPSDATVTVDGRAAAFEDGALKMAADGETHRLEISAEGHRAERRELVADRDRELSVTLERLPSLEKPAMTGKGSEPAAGTADKPAKAKPARKKAKGTGLMDSPYS